ncbi:FtsQ-type POTRA domain-containing protein [Aestuariirhabdus sp. Z084]|uniref:cell division protein FtsQ/DivIB n=1 Tax=Aestuariirhabdus haliotis TaxID=2918751 RepID=UPI00201B39A6|nr:FtsQ-type POTRA domain-containing protein [Aestuariirhabdus haliotis]MCL6415908.1 FtsQ-type POTRA domain-containing protein [Aestuariirhabdus haliotis]MCL6419906.1 FtsQ-type POTRA domain-containing protein [Aestuariirhabdus haliotis]
MKEIRNNKAKKRTPSGATTRGASRRQQTNSKRWLQKVARFLKIVSLAGLIASMVGGVAWFMAPVIGDVINQPIERVAVNGRFVHMPTEQVQLAMKPYLQERFFTVDLDDVQAELLSLPWVQSASIRRQWPGILDVTVVEQVPVARWRGDALLNSRGHSFVVGDTEGFTSLPHLIGPNGSEQEVMEQYQILSNMIRPLDLSVRQLALSERGSWQLVTEHFSIMIGRNRVVDKIQRFVAVYDAALKENNRSIKQVDVRYLNGVAVAWNDLGSQQPLISETVGRAKL